MGRFEKCLPVILKSEGGYVDHPQDPGGATMKGVTLAVYRQRKPGATKADLRAISDDEVAAIYRKGYWDAARCDDLPVGVDLMVFDFAVNSGVSRAAKCLQAAVSVVADGEIGPKTIEAVKRADPKTIITNIANRRMAFLRSLATFGTFGTGWARRVSNTTSIAMLAV